MNTRELKLRIDALDRELEVIESRLIAINERLTTLDEAIARLENNINVDLYDIRSRIHDLDTKIGR